MLSLSFSNLNLVMVGQMKQFSQKKKKKRTQQSCDIANLMMPKPGMIGQTHVDKKNFFGQQKRRFQTRF